MSLLRVKITILQVQRYYYDCVDKDNLPELRAQTLLVFRKRVIAWDLYEKIRAFHFFFFRTNPTLCVQGR